MATRGGRLNGSKFPSPTHTHTHSFIHYGSRWCVPHSKCKWNRTSLIMQESARLCVCAYIYHRLGSKGACPTVCLPCYLRVHSVCKENKHPHEKPLNPQLRRLVLLFTWKMSCSFVSPSLTVSVSSLQQWDTTMPGGRFVKRTRVGVEGLLLWSVCASQCDDNETRNEEEEWVGSLMSMDN